MRVLICTDSFKHSLTAYEAGRALAEGLALADRRFSVSLLPLADGGEGTVRALVDATGGTIREARVHDPLMREINAQYGLLGDKKTAVIEMAAASGIELLREEERNPFFTTSYGTGELIRAAMDSGCNKIILGIGGSATIDGGAGLLSALGARFYDKNDHTLLPTGEKLNDICHIDLSQLDSRLQEITIEIASDVDNPLTGLNGAAYVYGPQKGARDGDLKILDHNLAAYASLLEKSTSATDLAVKPGTGAAGGLAISLLAFTRATLGKGFELIATQLKLEEQIHTSDLVITGEGKIDEQTRFGKTPFGVARLAKKHAKPVIAVAGTLEGDHDELFDLSMPIMEKPMDLNTALREAASLLKRTGLRIGRMIMISEKLAGPSS